MFGTVDKQAKTHFLMEVSFKKKNINHNSKKLIKKYTSYKCRIKDTK